MIGNYEVAICPIDFFRPSERVDIEAVDYLAQKIALEGIWNSPIPIEAESGIVMDGNHRLQAAIKLGLKYVPFVAMSYEDSRVKVFDWNSGEPYDLRKIHEILDGEKILPYKSTRHIFDPPIPLCKVPLDVLVDNCFQKESI